MIADLKGGEHFNRDFERLKHSELNTTRICCPENIWEVGENSIMMSFVTCTLHNTYLE
jgi:hypothetical protein